MQVFTIKETTDPNVLKDLENFDKEDMVGKSGHVTLGVADLIDGVKGAVVIKAVREDKVFFYAISADTLDHIDRALSDLKRKALAHRSDEEGFKCITCDGTGLTGDDDEPLMAVTCYNCKGKGRTHCTE